MTFCLEIIILTWYYNIFNMYIVYAFISALLWGTIVLVLKKTINRFNCLIEILFLLPLQYMNFSWSKLAGLASRLFERVSMRVQIFGIKQPRYWNASKFYDWLVFQVRRPELQIVSKITEEGVLSRLSAAEPSKLVSIINPSRKA